MSDQTEDQEKTEAPTPRRLEKAREEGQVARSRELTTYLMLLAGGASLWLTGTLFYSRLGTIMEQAFVFDRSRLFDVNAMLQHAASVAELTLIALLPLMGVLTVMALTAPIVLGGWSMSAKSLAPNFSKLNPLQGLKRMLSSQALIELVKVIAKALLIGGVAVFFLSTRTGDLLQLMDQPIQQALAKGVELTATASGLMVATLLVVVLIDVPYQLWSHTKKLRMSREEIKREHKESDGDPQVKARIRSMQQSMARKRMMSQVPHADVIITNPTHYAVALRYDQERMSAPRVVAKGTDAVAARIRELGREHNVPLLEAPPLARALYAHVDLEREVPAELYTAVAEVLAWAFGLKRARRERSEVPPKPVRLDVPAALDIQKNDVKAARDGGDDNESA